MDLGRFTRNSALILGGSFLAVQITQLILVVLFEKVEYDTFTFYFSKVELMRWWTIDNHPLISRVQEFVPIGYSKLQMLFYGPAYGRNALNFIVTGVGALVVAQHLPLRVFVVFAVLTLANAAFFMQYTGYKTDEPQAVASVLLILAVSLPYFRFQLAAVCALTLLILSIKWHGLLVIAIAGLLYLPNFWRTVCNRDPRLAEDLVAAAVITVALFNYLELGSYLDAFTKTGSFTPTESFGVAPLRFSLTHLFLGFAQYMMTSLVETFEPVWRRTLDYPWVGSFLETVTFGAKDHVMSAVGQMRLTISALDGMGMIASAGVLIFRRKEVGPFVRNCAIAALFVTAMTLALYPFQPLYANRYFLPAQILSYVPLAWVLLAVWGQWLRSRPEASQERLVAVSILGLAAFHILTSAYMLVRDHERNLITINDISGITTKQIKAGAIPDPQWLKPIYRNTPTERTFRGWSGFQVVYDAMHRSMTVADPLLIVTDTRTSNADYSFPFLRERSPANTILLDIQRKPFAPGAPAVLCFSTPACAAVERSGAYAKIADQGPTIALWRKHP